MKSDEELKKHFTLYLDQDGIVKCDWLVEPQDRGENVRQAQLWGKAAQKFLDDNPGGENVRQAQLWGKAAQKFLDDNPGKEFNFLIDLCPAGIGLTQPPPKESRDIYQKVLANRRWRKIALLAEDPFLWTVAQFVLYAAGRDQTFQMFREKEKALKWLKK